MKQRLQIAAIGLCLTLAGVLLIWQWPTEVRGLESIPDSRLIWVRCRRCDHTTQTSEREFIRQQRAAMEALGSSHVVPGVPCLECQAPALTMADQCQQCNTVFIWSSQGDDFPDRCPACRVSAMQRSRQPVDH